MRLDVRFTLFALPLLLLVSGCTDPGPNGGPARPRHLRAAPGETLTLTRGIAYFDPRTGAAEGWELPEQYEPEDILLAHAVSPYGRYLAWADYDGTPGRPGHWQLLDTHSGDVRDLPAEPIFSPDETLYATSSEGADDLAIVRSDDGAAVLSVDLAAWGKPSQNVAAVHWSPTGAGLLVAFGLRPRDAPLGGGSQRLLHITPAAGDVREVPEGSALLLRWWPDGTAFSSGDQQRVTVYDAVTLEPRWTLDGQDLLPPEQREPDKSPVQLGIPIPSPDGAALLLYAGGPFGVPNGDGYSPRHYVLDPADGGVRFWISGAVTCGPPWSADGAWMVVDGIREGRYGSYLVRADGGALRPIGTMSGIIPSPTDPDIATAFRWDSAGRRFEISSIPDGEPQRTLPFDGPFGWDGLHMTWLSDGRMIAHAPHGGHGGCGAGPPPPELDVGFP